MLNHFLNNFHKTLKKSRKQFFEPQICQITDANLTKSVDFWVNFRYTSSKIVLLVQTIYKKSSHPIGRLFFFFKDT